jgi:hypothetical protein
MPDGDGRAPRGRLPRAVAVRTGSVPALGTGLVLRIELLGEVVEIGEPLFVPFAGEAA